MSDLTTDALVEAVARAMCDDVDGAGHWDHAPEDLRRAWRSSARAALAAVAKAAGGAADLREVAADMEGETVDATLAAMDRVVALLRALAGASDG